MTPTSRLGPPCPQVFVGRAPSPAADPLVGLGQFEPAGRGRPARLKGAARIALGPFALVVLAASSLSAQGSLTTILDQRISAALATAGAPSVSVAVVQNGQLVYAKAFGKADIAHDRAADPTTRYAIGSISKQFTAAAILLLQEQGKLSLDDPVAKYLPDLTRANEVTIRELLSHTSGYEDYAPQDYIIPEWTKPITPQQIMDRWAKKPLNFDPGTRWQYSNTNYVIAGEIFQKVSGQPLVAFLREKIFGPLEMASPGEITEHEPGDALAYTRFALGPPRPVEREGPGWMFAAGELAMTPSDLARWDIAFMEKRILSARSYEDFTHEVKLKDGKETHYALGLSVGERNGSPTYSHGGEVSGFLASNAVYPASKASITILSNEDGISFIGPLSQQIASIILSPESAAETEKEIAQVRGILEGLQQGKIDRELFTSNANTYFTTAALRDYQTSLAALGKLESVTKSSDSLRGGMTHRVYRATFEKKSVLLNIYVMPGGKYEQFLVMDTI